jgi:hypothetical protein
VRHAFLEMAMERESGVLPSDPRPDDMAELARKVAIELRKRAIWAEVESGEIYVPRVYGRQVKFGYVGLYRADFDNLGPIGCADVIQAEEARRAQEWAGDAQGEANETNT